MGDQIGVSGHTAEVVRELKLVNEFKLATNDINGKNKMGNRRLR